MKIIYTAKMEEIYVDDADYDWLNQYTWWISSRDHAQAYIDGENVYMAWLLCEREDGCIVDHIDRCSRNNQRHNLRSATYTQNAMNTKKQEGTTSKYKGVSWYSKSGKWTMKYYENKRQMHGGYFDDEDEAALAYNREVFRIYGEYANLNQVMNVSNATEVK